MEQLTEHFKRSEFACACGCGFDDIDMNLVLILEQLRYAFNNPVFINSGCRCKEHNKRVKGSSKSKHMEGIAADVRVLGVEPKVVADWFNDNHPDNGIGNYKTFTHFDVRGKKARWGNWA